MVLALLPCVAGAEETPHSRASCPEGAVLSGETGGVQVCAPQNCAADDDCGPGRVCRDRPLCVSTPMGSTTKDAVGTCESGGKCTYPAECEEASKRCVRAGLAERYRASCGCDVPGMGGGGAFALVGVLIGGVLVAARRARGRRGV